MYALDSAAVATPIGWVMIEGDDAMVHRLSIIATGTPHPGRSAAVREAAAQIDAYFAGRLQVFDLLLAPSLSARGGVLREAIVAVSYGETASYGTLAARTGSSARAVGQACARNPFPLVVPCHRVVQADGGLGPYSAGLGPVTKRWLLDFEGGSLF